MLKIGHRGAAGYAPENTIESFRKAISLGVDIIEFDVQATADGVLVVFHDKTLERMTNGAGYLSDYNYSELKANVRINGTGEPIPTLEEVCGFFSGEGVKLYVEIKVLGIEKSVLNILSAKLSKDNFIIASFFHRVIKSVKEIDPQVQTLAILACSPVSIEKIIEDTDCGYLGLDIDFIEERDVKKCHEMSRKVFVWTADDKRDIELMKKLGVDGIVSNFPDRI